MAEGTEQQAMKKLFLVLPLALLCGCGTLLPKKVELFQRKVKAVPELTADEKETQRKAADYVAQKTEETKINAIATGASTNVILPATDANTVAGALSQSLGPPESPWKKDAPKLAGQLAEEQSDFNRRLDYYRQHVDKDEGKKIEGTGLVRVGYFTMWAIILGVVLLIWFGLKIYGTINPVVGLGVNTFGRVSSSVLRRGFAEVSEAGESFKRYLEESDLDDKAIQAVKDLFSRAHRESQSRDVQDIIREITK
jgi:hypothetical protein